MSSLDFHINFSYKRQPYHFDLIHHCPTPETVSIDGMSYLLKGNDISWLKEKFPEITTQEGINSQAIHDRLWSLKAQDIQLIGKTIAVAFQSLSGRTERGKAIILTGASTSGKTTIINAIRELEPERKEVGIDMSFFGHMYSYLARHYAKYGISKEDWQHLHRSLLPRERDLQIHQALGGEYRFKPNLSEEDMQRVEKTTLSLRAASKKFFEKHSSKASQYAIHQALQLAQNGLDIVCDIVQPSDVFQDPLSKNLPVKHVLIYCPFHDLSNRISERNRAAKEAGRTEDIRPGAYPLQQFSEFFSHRKESDSDSDVIETVAKKTVEEDFDLHFDFGIEVKKKLDPAQVAQMDIEAVRKEKKEKLLSNLGFGPSDPPDRVIELTPKRKYDLLVNTSDPGLGATPTERGKNAARHILEMQ